MARFWLVRLLAVMGGGFLACQGFRAATAGDGSDGKAAVAPPKVGAESGAKLAESETLDAKMGDVIGKILATQRRLNNARERALRDDQELAAAQKDILEKQAELEQLLLRRYPDIAKLTKEKDQLLREHSNSVARLTELKKMGGATGGHER
jgi:hypothetical protein